MGHMQGYTKPDFLWNHLLIHENHLPCEIWLSLNAVHIPVSHIYCLIVRWQGVHVDALIPSEFSES